MKKTENNNNMTDDLLETNSAPETVEETKSLAESDKNPHELQLEEENFEG